MSSGVPRKIQIAPVMNGYLVTVGCQTLVFNTPKDLLKELERYLEKPVELEKEYAERALHCGILKDVAFRPGEHRTEPYPGDCAQQAANLAPPEALTLREPLPR